MSMHLMNIRVTPKKHKSAVTKAKQAQWEQECKQHNKWLKSAGMATLTLQQYIDQKHGKVSKTETFKPLQRALPEVKQRIPSLKSLGSGVCAKPAPKVYTGTAMIGIATMHKSNSVPIFSQQEAVDVASMRR